MKKDFTFIGREIPVSILGLSVAGDKSKLSHDSVDCIPAIEHCGEDVYSLWLHTGEGVSVRLITNAADLIKMSAAIIKEVA